MLTRRDVSKAIGPLERSTPVAAISGCLYSIPSGMSRRTRWSLPVATFFTGSVVVNISRPIDPIRFSWFRAVEGQYSFT
jgi:hypothetical protein